MWKIHAGLVKLPPWRTIQKNVDRITPVQLFQDIINFFKEHFNTTFTEYDYIPYGEPSLNGSWNGFVGKLQRHELDVIFIPNLPFTKSFDVIHSTKPFYYSTTTIMYGARVTSLNLTSKFLIRAFENKMWYALLACIIVLPLVTTLHEVSFCTLVQSKYYYLKIFFSTILKYIGIIVSEPLSHLPRRFMSRVIFCIWCISIMILQNAYNGNLKSTFTTASIQTLDSMEDLARKPTLKVFTLRKSIFEAWFKESKLESAQKIYLMIVESGGNLLLEDMISSKHLEDVASGVSVYVLDYIPLVGFLSKFKCPRHEFTFSKAPIWDFPLTLAMHKSVPDQVKRRIDTWFSMYSATMQLRRGIRQFEYHAAPCLWKEEKLDTFQLSIDRLATPFEAYFLTLFSLVFIFLIELISIRFISR